MMQLILFGKHTMPTASKTEILPFLQHYTPLMLDTLHFSDCSSIEWARLLTVVCHIYEGLLLWRWIPPTRAAVHAHALALILEFQFVVLFAFVTPQLYCTALQVFPSSHALPSKMSLKQKHYMNGLPWKTGWLWLLKVDCNDSPCGLQ